jgi:hypothetical protein
MRVSCDSEKIALGLPYHHRRRYGCLGDDDGSGVLENRNDRGGIFGRAPSPSNVCQRGNDAFDVELVLYSGTSY